MNKKQRAILAVFGILTMWFSFNVTFDQYGLGVERPWLATVLWLSSIAMFFASASSDTKYPMTLGETQSEADTGQLPPS